MAKSWKATRGIVSKAEGPEKDEKRPVYLGEKRASVSGVLFLRACLYGGGEPQVGEVTRLAVVQK